MTSLSTRQHGVRQHGDTAVPVPARSTDELHALAVDARNRLADAPSEQVLDWAVETFGSALAVTSSMTDAVLCHLVSRRLPGVDVIFLDTGYHFTATLQVRQRIADSLPVTVRDVTPRLSVEEQDAVNGPRLYERDPQACCRMRKVEPLAEVLTGYQAWASGLRRADGPSRSGTPTVDWDARHGLVKVNPLAAWSDADVAAYIAEHDIAVNPLVARGFPSIGCLPCTRRPERPGDARSGRWAGTDRTECGIHL